MPVSSGSARSAPSVSTRLPPPSTYARSLSNHASFSALVNAPVPAPGCAARAVNVTAPVQVGSAAAQLST